MEAIEDYGLIGNQRTSALVSKTGCIDFYCAPRFDSPSLFARLLDKDGGYFSISPVERNDYEIGKTVYFPDACVLITRFNHNGVSEIWDFMPLSERLGPNAIVRRVKGVKGKSHLKLELCPRFNYAQNSHTAEIVKGGVKFSDGDRSFYFYSSRKQSLEPVENDLRYRFNLDANDIEYMLLTDTPLSDSDIKSLSSILESELEDTVDRWRHWIEQSTYTGRWQGQVNRSALTLKLLISQTHGAQVAAPTFSLPEHIGGKHNWDYRYVWLRDNCFTFGQFIRLGFTKEAMDFKLWLDDLLKRVPKDLPLCPLYTLDGHHEIREYELKHMSGYRDSSPVRIGNGAWKQLQLDVYGELLSFLNLYDDKVELLSATELETVKQLLVWLTKNWSTKDKGIWERRDSSRVHLYSLTMCWLCFNQALSLFERRSHPCPVELWRQTRDDIFFYIQSHLWSEEFEFYSHAEGEDRIDASALIVPLAGLCAPRDPRWLNTINRIEESLLEDNFVHRYSKKSKQSDFRSDEGTFSLCTFWYAECLAKEGKLNRARYIFERMLSFSSTLGLYSEEAGIDGHHLGNFPQALTHSALISCALALDDYESNFTSKEDSYEKTRTRRKDSGRYWSLSRSGSSPGT